MKHLEKKILVVVAMIGMVLLVSSAVSKEQESLFSIDQFISPETCADCHSQIFEQWQNSMHQLSHKDPVYTRLAKFLSQGLTDPDEIAEAESCVKCHTPVGYVTGFPEKVSDDWDKTPEIATWGIQCDYCHSAESVRQIHNNGLVIKPGQGEDDPGIKYGPFDDAVPDFHEAQYSKLHTDSTFCGTCHNVKHVVFGTDLETTYTEWENSSFNSSDPQKRVTCQGCHMYQRPGVPATGSTPRPENPGSAADYSDERPHIYTHYFVGGNVSVPAEFGGEDRALMALDRLQNAATLSVDTSMVQKDRQMTVHVANTGAGHSIPTGLGDLRQVWLEIVVQDKDQKILFQSGVLNDRHELPENVLIFHTVFGDGKGNRVINIAKAREILRDTRIKAGEQVTHHVRLPKAPPKDSMVTVRLLYRSLPQSILNLLPGDPIEPMPVVEMEKVQVRI